MLVRTVPTPGIAAFTILRYAPDGTLLDEMTLDPEGTTRSPAGLCVDALGNIFATGSWVPEGNRDILLYRLHLDLVVPGDLDGDGAVTRSDRAAFCASIGSVDGEPEYASEADLNDDGVIDEIDLAMLNALLPTCEGDIVSSDTFQPPADGVTDGADLAYLLGAWGEQPSCADMVNSKTFSPPPDGVVDGADLAFMLGAWGMCR